MEEKRRCGSVPTEMINKAGAGKTASKKGERSTAQREVVDRKVTRSSGSKGTGLEKGKKGRGLV